MKLLTSIHLPVALAVGIAFFDTSFAFAPPARTVTGAKSLGITYATISPDKNNIDINAASNNSDNKATIEFPPPLTKVQRLQRAAKFWSSAIPIVLSYYSKSAELRVKEAFTGIELTEDEEQLV